jgi:hypothetical protein
MKERKDLAERVRAVCIGQQQDYQLANAVAECERISDDLLDAMSVFSAFFSSLVFRPHSKADSHSPFSAHCSQVHSFRIRFLMQSSRDSHLSIIYKMDLKILLLTTYDMEINIHGGACVMQLLYIHDIVSKPTLRVLYVF